AAGGEKRHWTAAGRAAHPAGACSGRFPPPPPPGVAHAAQRGSALSLLRRTDRVADRRIRRRSALYRGLPGLLPPDRGHGQRGRRRRAGGGGVRGERRMKRAAMAMAALSLGAGAAMAAVPGFGARGETVEPWAPARIASARFESHPAFDPLNGDLYFV